MLYMHIVWLSRCFAKKCDFFFCLESIPIEILWVQLVRVHSTGHMCISRTPWQLQQNIFVDAVQRTHNLPGNSLMTFLGIMFEGCLKNLFVTSAAASIAVSKELHYTQSHILYCPAAKKAGKASALWVGKATPDSWTKKVWKCWSAEHRRNAAARCFCQTQLLTDWGRDDEAEVKQDENCSPQKERQEETSGFSDHKASLTLSFRMCQEVSCDLL